MTRAIRLVIQVCLVVGLDLLVSTGAGRAQSGFSTVSAGRTDLDILLQPTGEAVPRRDQHGTGVAAEALRDRLVVVSFVSVDCSIACVVRTLDLDRMVRSLPAALRARVSVLCIDTDPARDDAPRLRAFADGLVGRDTALRFLDSDAAATAALVARLRYPPSALPEPPPSLLLFDRRGQIAMTYGTDPLDAPRILRDLTTLEAFEDGVGRPPRGAPAPTL